MERKGVILSEAKDLIPPPPGACRCFDAPHPLLVCQRELGMDEQYGEASLWICPECGQYWLRYFYELEAFSGSGRWYLGAVTVEELGRLTAQTARAVLEELEWYHYGGSYFGGRTGRGSGTIY